MLLPAGLLINTDNVVEQWPLSAERARSFETAGRSACGLEVFADQCAHFIAAH
jgi:hypothetical protein